jgi:hypothetical protein
LPHYVITVYCKEQLIDEMPAIINKTVFIVVVVSEVSTGGVSDPDTPLSTNARA